ncbi:putative uncharacterized protein C6orf52 homolog isoform X3 [Myotis yumanensis]|uniref:putative uncharacterized protein C6orf52 homolog isoform X3 n=1 Tax=Myotis yumanensis TaxID=159337 RepID=UPI0038D2569F
MAGPKSFAGFDRAQQNNYYWYWQRVNPKFHFYQRDPFGNGYEQQHSCRLLPGCGCGPAVDGNEHTLSAHGTSGLPAGTPITPEETTALAGNQDENLLEVTAPVCIPTSSEGGFLFLHILTSTCRLLIC